MHKFIVAGALQLQHTHKHYNKRVKTSFVIRSNLIYTYYDLK